jgi:hypothetical protein
LGEFVSTVNNGSLQTKAGKAMVPSTHPIIDHLIAHHQAVTAHLHLVIHHVLANLPHVFSHTTTVPH